MTGAIRIGIGGWTFPPWRGAFYPKGVRPAGELGFASRKLTAIEINGTHYSSYRAETFAAWAAETPPGFVFSLKASRLCTNRRVLAEAGEAVQRFFDQGVTKLGDRLGPVCWQFAKTKRFDRDDFAAFLDLLPSHLAGLPLRHVVEVRHESFKDERFVDLCRERRVAICIADHEVFPMISDVTADFVYVRLMKGRDDVETCYPSADLDAWAGRLRAWARGASTDLPPIDPAVAVPPRDRDVFAYFIRGGKPRAPAGATALMERLEP